MVGGSEARNCTRETKDNKVKGLAQAQVEYALGLAKKPGRKRSSRNDQDALQKSNQQWKKTKIVADPDQPTWRDIGEGPEPGIFEPIEQSGPEQKQQQRD